MRTSFAAALCLFQAFSFTPLSLAQEAPAPAAEPAAGDKGIKPSLTVMPVLLDSDGGNATLGVEYEFRLKAPIVKTISNSEDFGDVDDPFGQIDLSVESAGTIATSPSRNPKNFIDASVGLGGTYFFGASSPFGWISLDAQFKYETDQKFEKEQTVLGGRVTWLKDSILLKNDVLAIDVGYGRVKPSDKDTDRQAALATQDLRDFDRIDFEALYMVPVKSKIVRQIEFNYRLYKEVNPAAAIVAAKLDKFELATVRAKLPGDFFVAYSTGRLPFDLKDNQIVELGLSYKFF